MFGNLIEQKVTEFFRNAGIQINGGVSSDIQVKDDRFFSMVFWRGHDGFADAYVNGYWTCDSLDQCVEKLIENEAIGKLCFRPANIKLFLRYMFLNEQKPGRARKNVVSHYDRGPVFDIMLDPMRCYSCAYWDGVTTLAAAQLQKLDIICRKLYLKTGMTFYDIGCGWGGLIKHAAGYGCYCTGITHSDDQFSYIQELRSEFERDIDALTTGGSFNAQLTDYRNLTAGEFDRIASVGMFEHVGPKNFRTYMQAAAKHLKSDGLFLLHTISSPEGALTLRRPGLPWIEKHIFPCAAVPSIRDITKAAHGIFKVLDMENFGHYYDRTLMSWAKNFESGWRGIKSNYQAAHDPDGLRFFRMWQYYLHSCAAMFRTGQLDLFQIVFAHHSANRGVYKRPHIESAARVSS